MRGVVEGRAQRKPLADPVGVLQVPPGGQGRIVRQGAAVDSGHVVISPLPAQVAFFGLFLLRLRAGQKWEGEQKQE